MLCCWLWRWRKGLWAKKLRGLLESEKLKGSFSPRVSRKYHKLAGTLILVQWEEFWISNLSVQFSYSLMSDSLGHTSHQASMSITNSWNLLRLLSIKSVMPSNHLILSRPLLLLPLVPPSIRVFSNESTLCTRWPKYWSFSISPSSEYSGLISFRID